MNTISQSATSDFTPDATQKREVNVTLDPAKADALFKSIGIAHGLSRSALYFIVQSVLVGLLWNGAGIFLVNLVKAIGNGVNLKFLADSPQIKAFSLLKNRKVHLIEHHDSSVYELTDYQNAVLLFKTSVSHKAPTAPDLSEEEKIGVKVFMKEFQKLKSLVMSSHPTYWILRLYSNQLVSVQLPGLSPHVVDPAACRESKGKPDILLKSFTLMMVPGDEIHLSVFKSKEAYWLKLEAEIALGITVQIFEPVSELRG